MESEENWNYKIKHIIDIGHKEDIIEYLSIRRNVKGL